MVMSQSYDVFMLNRRVKFRPMPKDLSLHNHDYNPGVLTLLNPTAQILRDLPTLLKRNANVQDVVLFASDLEQVWMDFCSGYRELAAAGGVVQDEEGYILWIQRNGKWDLPKGKLEPGERLEEAAVREVEEETGITNLKITGDAFTTFHTYEAEGVVHLKTTFWYPMRHAGKRTKGIPQAVEGISAVTWLIPPFSEDVTDNTFGSIRNVLEALLPSQR